VTDIRGLSRHKVAKVDQMETAIGKSMRERDGKSKADKVIRRGLSYVLTAGTLVDSGMLTSDMSIYCMSIKVCEEILPMAL
jgi:DNA mismatch repair protein MSH6